MTASVLSGLVHGELHGAGARTLSISQSCVQMRFSLRELAAASAPTLSTELRARLASQHAALAAAREVAFACSKRGRRRRSARAIHDSLLQDVAAASDEECRDQSRHCLPVTRVRLRPQLRGIRVRVQRCREARSMFRQPFVFRDLRLHTPARCCARVDLMRGIGMPTY
jgi:signal transduction histidine kinase